MKLRHQFALPIVAACLCLTALPARGTVTLQFSQVGIGRATGFGDSTATVAGTNGMRWGIVVDTLQNGLSGGGPTPTSMYDSMGFTNLSTPGFLMVNGVLTDGKTAAATYGPDRMDFDLQPTVYIAAAEHLYGAAGRVNFEFWLLLKTKKPQFKILPVVRDARDRAELVEAIDDVEHACIRGVYPRMRGYSCVGCEYAKRCSAGRG